MRYFSIVLFLVLLFRATVIYGKSHLTVKRKLETLSKKLRTTSEHYYLKSCFYYEECPMLKISSQKKQNKASKISNCTPRTQRTANMSPKREFPQNQSSCSYLSEILQTVFLKMDLRCKKSADTAALSTSLTPRNNSLKEIHCVGKRLQGLLGIQINYFITEPSLIAFTVIVVFNLVTKVLRINPNYTYQFLFLVIYFALCFGRTDGLGFSPIYVPFISLTSILPYILINVFYPFSICAYLNKLLLENVLIAYIVGLLPRKQNRSSSQGKTTQQTLKEGHCTRKFSPVAIVGISCRFAQGVNSKDSFWKMLIQGDCVIGSYPENRLEEKEMSRFYNPGRLALGKHYTLKGAFLDKVSGFDAQFFGISPAECRALDPQQRLLLQGVYEAIEDAGLRLEDLQECRTGVYVGLMNLDYGRLLLDDPNVPKIDEFASTGITASTVANRISYSLNFTGPSLTVDTACSSSLTALNIAVTHLQQTECDVAIVCAPNLILARYFHTACCRTGLLAQDGRCKSFDAKGDGYGRGEGVAAVILKPTAITLRDRDDPYAQIIACGLNNDGQNAIPMTGPSDKMQAELAQRVLGESGLAKDDIQYVEAHGTGTAVGDPVEMRSVSSVYGNSSDRVLRIGSVKSNINHTESTAGLAGLIKTCLMIKYKYFVPTVNVHELKPQLMIPERKMMVQTKLEPWLCSNEKLRTAAVCCYGYGGANAHAIVQEVNQPERRVSHAGHRACWVMTLSARSRDALRMMAKRLSEWIVLQRRQLLEEDVCYTLNNRRTLHTHRLAVTFRTLEQAAALMKMFGEEGSGYERFITVGKSTAVVKKLAFIYGGQGAGWHGMAKEMIENEPRFRESIAEIDLVLRRSLGVQWCLMEELTKPQELSRVHGNVIGQTSLFGLHYAMAELLKSWGIIPSAVIGHSLGEISAACIAHLLTLKEALQLVLLRSQLHESCSATGRMTAIGLSAEQTQELVTSLRLENRVSIAIRNSPEDVVLSGDADAIRAIEDHVSQDHADVFCKRLATTRAYHSNDMEQIKEEFMKGLEKIKIRERRAKIPFYSTVTGAQISALTHGHWWNNIREPVLFTSAIETMVANGYKTFVEINASPQFPRHVQKIVTQYQTTRPTQDTKVSVIATLPKKSGNEQHMSFLRNCPSSLFVCGYPIAWEKIQGTGSEYFVRCPTYPWQERDYWYRDSEPVDYVRPFVARQPVVAIPTHPLLGKSVPAQAFTGLHVWEAEIDLHRLPYLKDHAFQDSENSVVPGAVYVEIALAMVLHMCSNAIPRLKVVKFNNLLTLTANDVLTFRTRLEMSADRTEDCGYQTTMIEENGSEVLVSEGFAVFETALRTSYEGSQSPNNSEKISTIKSRLTNQPLEIFNMERVKRRFNYGPQFSLITETWRGDHEALCTISLTEEVRCTTTPYVLHPSIIDACFQSLFLLRQRMEKPVPYRVDDVTILRRNVTERMYCHVIATSDDTTCNIVLMDYHGNAILLMKGFLMVDMSSLQRNLVLKDVAYDVMWEQQLNDCSATVANSGYQATEEKVWLILADRNGLAKQFFGLLPNNQSSILLELPDKPSELRLAFRTALAQATTNPQSKKICVVSFLPVDNTSLAPEWKNFRASHQLAFESSLVLLQVILETGELANNIQLVLVCSESIPLEYNKTSNPPTFPWSSTLFGFRRTLAEELTDPETTIVDLSYNPSPNDFQLMVSDLHATKVPEEVAYRSGRRYVNKIKKLGTNVGVTTKVLPSVCRSGDPRPFRLLTVSGRSRLKEAARMEPREAWSEIHVSNACPILHNYWTAENDKVVVCGKLTGSNTQSTSEDDLVVTVCDVSGLGNYIVVEDEKIIKLGDKLSAEEAVSLCFPMALSFHIVSEVLRNCTRKRFLVYADQEEYACVFVGVALSFGAEVTCVTKTSRSRVQLHEIGASVVITEDDLLMEAKNLILDCDVVVFLSLPRETILQQIVDGVQDGGEIIVISKDESDYFNIRITKNIAFVKVRLDKITDLNGLLLQCIGILTSTGYLDRLKNIPRASMSIYDAVGSPLNPKPENEPCVIRNFVAEKKDVVFMSSALDSICLKENRTYLIVGGVRGFGFEVARWMIENGAKTIMCTARSPPNQSKTIEVERLMEATGAHVIFRQADVTSWEDMTLVKKELDNLPEIAGIVFSAMVLEDQRIKDADLETCARVISTKVQGSVVLHQLSLTMDLDFFIMFSSIAGVIGNVGQLAYSAANSFLDSLCSYRKRKLGLPALSVDWGTMGGAGVLERSKEIANLFKSYGFHLMSCAQGMDLLSEFLLQNPYQTQVMLCDIDWDTYLKSSAYVIHRSPRLEAMKDEMPSYKVNVQSESHVTLKDLQRQDREQRRETVEKFVRSLLSSWSEGCPSEVDLNLAFYKYGIDSIGAANMSLQMRNWIGALFEIYYFIQPKTNGLTLINDTLKQIEDLAKKHENDEQIKIVYKEGMNYESLSANECDDDLKIIEPLEKVMPLYVPDDAVVNVFMIHSSHKSALENVPFATGFQKQDSVSLYSIGVDKELVVTSKYGSVRELAKKYVTLIKKQQKHGPYYLAGFSFGGVISYEMACQLTEEGDEVAMVFMLDTFPWYAESNDFKHNGLRNTQQFWMKYFTETLMQRFLKTVAVGHLGLSLEEFQKLVDNGTGESPWQALERRALERNITLEDLMEQLSGLTCQIKEASLSFFNWKPSKNLYQQTLTYVGCRGSIDIQNDHFVWNAPEAWKSLTTELDMFSVPVCHFDLLDQPNAEICGLFMMTTALIRHHTQYTIKCNSRQRSRRKERCIEWLKEGIDISIYSDNVASKVLFGQLTLNDDESLLTFTSNTSKQINEVINLLDVHNIVPGKYVHILNSVPEEEKQLIVTLLLTKNSFYHFRCFDWKQRNSLLETFEAFFETPLLKF